MQQPNGLADNYTVNDILYSEYEFVSEYPEIFAIWFKTNNQPNESSYELRDNEGNLIFSEQRYCLKSMKIRVEKNFRRSSGSDKFFDLTKRLKFKSEAVGQIFKRA